MGTQGHQAEFAKKREAMVRQQIAARGVTSPRVLAAMRSVEREGYVPSYLGEFAYEDTALPIEEEQTISQPYIVAFMLDALELTPRDRVLEVGTGSGYAAAALAEIAAEVHTIERHEKLAKLAAERLRRDGYSNVRVHHGDGTLGWADAAPFEAIVVAAGGPDVPETLRMQLAIGGRLVMPVGEQSGLQELVRVRRLGPDSFKTERLADVRFVPLVGKEGFRVDARRDAVGAVAPHRSLLVGECAEPFADVDSADLDALCGRLADSRVVLLGEATHGTAEFYRMRARITRQLIERHGFQVVACEADWSDAARIDHYVRDRDVPRGEWQAFARFPAWMWRNRQVREFVDWLHARNMGLPRDRRVRFSGLDVYGLYNSIDTALRFLDARDPVAARAARERWSCLSPWHSDPAAYGRAAVEGGWRSCEREVAAALHDLLHRRVERMKTHDEEWFEMLQDAHVVKDAEAYYRAMYAGSVESWNLRDAHMADSLGRLLDFCGPKSKAVVWAHNSHVGDAAATSMAARGEWNLGQLCRDRYGDACSLVGFGTDRGVVAAASHWGGPMQRKAIRPSHAKSFERICHDAALPAFVLSLREPKRAELRTEFHRETLQRAIGVIYRPETEMQSHYLHAALSRQFDEFLWFDVTTPVDPIESVELEGTPDTYPFGV